MVILEDRARFSFPVPIRCILQMAAECTARTPDVLFNQRRSEARKVNVYSSTSITAKNIMSCRDDKFEFAENCNFDILPVSLIRRGVRSWQTLPNHEQLFGTNHDRLQRRDSLVLSGWDIIIPSEWSRSVWTALQFAGAVAIGQSEAEAISLEAGVPSFPRDFPDAAAGIQYWTEKKALVENEIKKLPKKNTPLCHNRRGSIVSFDILFKNLNTSFDDFEIGVAVVRTAAFLHPFVPEPIRFIRKTIPKWKYLFSKNIGCRKEQSASSPCKENATEFPFPTMPFPTLVSVFLQCDARGAVQSGASIYCPIEADLSLWMQHRDCKREYKVGSRKRIGHWRGFSCANGTQIDRKLAGFVTSSDSASMSGCEIGIGFCGVVQIFECISLQRTFIIDGCSATQILLLRNPGSNYLRPVQFKLLV